jgi:hypothetical protein
MTPLVFMKPRTDSEAEAPPLTTELLLLPDGRVLVHNLTPAFAELLHALNAHDEQIAPRLTHHESRITHPKP